MIDVGRHDRTTARDLRTDEFGRQPFADRDEFHLGRDLAAPRIVELRHRVAGLRAQDGPTGSTADFLHILPLTDPFQTDLRKADVDVDVTWTAGVVDSKRRLALRQRDLAHRHAHAVRTFHMNPSRVRKRAIEIDSCQGFVLLAGHFFPI